MRLGKKLRIATILMSMAMAATTLIFATFAITQNNADADYDGILRVIGNADIDVEIEFIEVKSGDVLYKITADENGIIEEKGGKVVNRVTDVADLTTYGIETKPELALGKDYKFIVTIRNRGKNSDGTGYASAVVNDVSFRPENGFDNYFIVHNPIINDENNKVDINTTKKFEIYLDTNPSAELKNGDIDFSYTLNIEAHKA